MPQLPKTQSPLYLRGYLLVPAFIAIGAGSAAFFMGAALRRLALRKMPSAKA